MKTNWFSSIFPDIRKKYSDFLNILVSISSTFFTVWLLMVFFFRGEEFFIIILSLALFIASVLLYGEQQEKEKNALLLYNPYKSEKLRIVNEYLRLIGSIIFSLLFINLYLGISDFLNQQFTIAWENIELALNMFGLIFLSVVAFLLICLVGFDLLFKFTFFIIRDKEKRKRIGGPLVTFYFFICILLFPATPFWLSVLAYEKLGWLVGFSLLFLHLNYLINLLIILFEPETDSNIVR